MSSGLERDFKAGRSICFSGVNFMRIGHRSPTLSSTRKFQPPTGRPTAISKGKRICTLCTDALKEYSFRVKPCETFDNMFISVSECMLLLRSTRCGVLGLDVGGRKIGVSTCAFPWDNLVPMGKMYRRANLFRVLMGKIEQSEAGLLVVGWPLELSGRTGKRCAEVMRFVSDLKTNGIETPVARFDERFTTLAAREVLGEVGCCKRKRAQAEDEVAAVTILDGFLSTQPIRDVVGDRHQNFIPINAAQSAASRACFKAFPRRQDKTIVPKDIFREIFG